MRMIQIASGELARLEVGKNGGPDVRRYQAATGLAPGAWPWCAAFVCWVYRATCKELAPGLLPTRPKTALAYGFETWGRDHGRVFRTHPRPQPGDLVVYRFSHVGICSMAGGALGGFVSSFFAIEGNTERAGTGPQGVWTRQRPHSELRSIVRLYESTTPQT